MTIAALALALALMVAPSRHRLHGAPATRRRLPALVMAVALAAMSLVLPVAATLAVCIVVSTLALRRRRSAARCARAAEGAFLQSALDVLIGELRVGAHPLVAFDVAAGEADGTVAKGLRAVGTTRFGRAAPGADSPSDHVGLIAELAAANVAERR